MAQQSVVVGGSYRRYFIFIAVLLAALVALLSAYFMLTKPPVAKTAKKQKDFTHILSIYGFEGDLLRRPNSVTLDEQGRIFIADTGKNRVVVFDQDGNFVKQFGDQGEDRFQIKDPIAMAIAPDGQIFVLSKTLKKVVVYNASFKPINEILFGDFPLSLTIHDKKLYVTTSRGIMIGDLSGNLITTYGKRGIAPGEFQMPGGIAVDDDGNMYVADSLNYRVQALNKNGEPRWQYGKPLPPNKAISYQGKDRKFGLPASITLDDNGHLFVVDGLNCQLVVLSTKGKYISTIGDIGHDDGFFYYPDGITYAGGGKIALADKFNDRVQLFQVPIATPASATIFAWAPYLLLLLIPLLLWLLLRPRLQIVASEDFLEAVLDNDRIDDLKRAFKRLVVVPEALGNLQDRLPNDLKLVQKEATKAKMQRMSSYTGLTKTQMATLALVDGVGGKRVLLTDAAAVKKIAESLNIATMTYSEFVSAYERQTGGEEA